jgi:hypothetical protein
VLLLLVPPPLLPLLTVSPMLAQMAPLAWRPISPVSRMICSAAGEEGAGRGKPGSPQAPCCVQVGPCHRHPASCLLPWA